MKSLIECINEARVAKMNRKKFMDNLISYSQEQNFIKVDNDDSWKYKSYPKPNTVLVKENSIEFFYEDGISLRVCNYAPNNRSKNLLKVEVRSYNNKGYSKSSDIAIKVWTEKHEYFDINKLLGEEANEILNKIKTLIDPKTINKIVSKYFKKSDNGYEKKSDKFNDRIINYEDIK